MDETAKRVQHLARLAGMGSGLGANVKPIKRKLYDWQRQEHKPCHNQR
jgi:hypothetical protein